MLDKKSQNAGDAYHAGHMSLSIHNRDLPEFSRGHQGNRLSHAVTGANRDRFLDHDSRNGGIQVARIRQKPQRVSFGEDSGQFSLPADHRSTGGTGFQDAHDMPHAVLRLDADRLGRMGLFDRLGLKMKLKIHGKNLLPSVQDVGGSGLR